MAAGYACIQGLLVTPWSLLASRSTCIGSRQVSIRVDKSDVVMKLRNQSISAQSLDGLRICLRVSEQKLDRQVG